VSEPADTQPSASRPGRHLRAALIVVALGVLILFGRQLAGYVPAFAAAVAELGPWGPVVFVAGYAVAAVAFVPGSLLTLAAGAVFGLLRGTAYVFVGATLGAAAAFLVARHLARHAVERRLRDDPRLQAIDRAVARQGRRIVFLLRLSPLFPFNLLNYALGLTQVRFADYLVASIGMLPGTLLYVYYGKVLGDVAAVAAGRTVEKGPADYALLALGLLATLAATTLVARAARRALNEAAHV
jgi:uncharacterized membrane protein YdjX (TVP38/TMEM64 family)